MKSKIEMHSHIMGQSSDSHVSAKEYVDLLLEKGYSGIVTTDHYMANELHKSWKSGITDLNRAWLTGYRAVTEAATGTGLQVYLGMEYNLEYVNGYIDILLYGLSEELVESGLIRPYMSLPELCSFCKENDILMIQAHPERYGHHRLPVEAVDGYEIKNTKIREKYDDGYNLKIQEFVKDKPHLICTGGSDSHYAADVGKGGISSDAPILSMEDLLKALRSHHYSVLGI